MCLSGPVEKITFHVPVQPVGKITPHLSVQPVGKITSHVPGRVRDWGPSRLLICISRLSRHVCVITLYFLLPCHLPVQVCTSWIFQARAQADLNITILARPEREVTISTRARNKIQNLGPRLARPLFFPISVRKA